MKIVGTTHVHANTFKRTSSHVRYDRKSRLEFVNQLGGQALLSYLVDSGSIEGIQIHTILDTGAIVIGSLRTRQIITILVPRPARLRLYGITDKKLLKIAEQNELNYFKQVINGI